MKAEKALSHTGRFSGALIRDYKLTGVKIYYEWRNFEAVILTSVDTKIHYNFYEPVVGYIVKIRKVVMPFNQWLLSIIGFKTQSFPYFFIDVKLDKEGFDQYLDHSEFEFRAQLQYDDKKKETRLIQIAVS